MQNQEDMKGQKQHKSFRFVPKSSQQLKEIAALFGRSETAMLEQIIETYYEKRAQFFDEDRIDRLSKLNANEK